MKHYTQKDAPYLEALKKYVKDGVSPFDVPGHHQGNISNGLKSFLGAMSFKADINAPIGMDNLNQPRGVLLAAENLMAEFAHAEKSFFLVNGTTGGIIAMIMASVKPKESIIIPRNVHKSIINSMILSGANPIYVMPAVDAEIGIANQPSVEDYVKTMDAYPSAKAVLVINPTYFGVVTDLESIVKEAHKRNMAVLVDEAHGAHYYFDSNGPKNAMECGADMSSVSFHKTGGSLTQSSVLLWNSKIVPSTKVQKTLNILTTTSPSTILLASIDAARQHVAAHGEAEMKNVHKLSKYVRDEIKKIPGFVPLNKDRFKKLGFYDYDETKLVIEIDGLDFTGFDIYKMLKKKYNIQLELGETRVFLGILALGSKKEHLEHLINALKDISKKYLKKKKKKKEIVLPSLLPFSIIPPREAFGAPGKRILIEEASGQISKESIMIYPPGIPIIVPGEVFTDELVKKITNYIKWGSTLLSDYGTGYAGVIDQNKWDKFYLYKNKLNDYMLNRLTTPINDGYVMPFEGDKHQATIVLIPFRKDTWRRGAEPAQKQFKNVIMAISKYEDVYVGIAPSIYKKVAPQYANKKHIITAKLKYNDAWARDIGPVFVKKENKLRIVDFRFNAWGGEVEGLYNNYKDDDLFAKNCAHLLKLERYYLDQFFLEGGSINVDGQGTCLVTKRCLLSEGRNAYLSMVAIEEILKKYLNVSNVIWLDHGIVDDETTEHIDNIAVFVRPGVIALAWTNDQKDLQYKYSSAAYETLKKARDTNGNPFKIVKILLPKPMYTTKEDVEGIYQSGYEAKPRVVGARLAASYINFYQGHNFVIIPKFGVPEDKLALNKFKKLFPDKDVIQLDSREILLGGSNIHGITMQIPYVEKETK